MQVKVKGASYSLTQHDFVAKGGQGSVYAKNGTAFKVYHKPSDMLPTAKMAELATIADPNVVRPIDIVSTTKGQPIGYTMRFVKDTYVLCQLFPKAFKERNKLKPDHILNLVLGLRKSVQHIHSCGVQIIDLNELNLLASKDFSEIFLIDADSYQTKSCRAVYLMPSVRDWSVEPHEFSESSDWFSFAIVTFQMFIGIHPYKGKHPDIKKLEDRMKANISVFDKAVSIPKACYSFDTLPAAYRKWYEAVFISGERTIPPSSANPVTVISVPIQQTLASGNLHIEEIRTYPGPVTQFFDAEEAVYIENRGVFVKGTQRWQGSRGKLAILASAGTSPCAVTTTDGRVIVNSLVGTTKEVPTRHVTDLMEYEGRVFIKMRGKISELGLVSSGNETIPVLGMTVNTMQHATEMYPGVVIENMLGSIFVSVFPKKNARYQIRVEELEEHKVVNAKYDSGVLVVIAVKAGKYDRFVFRFDADHTEYDLRITENINTTDINFVALHSGVCILLNEEEKLEVFSSKKDSRSIKMVEDSILSGDMRLVRLDGGLGFYTGNQLFSIRMK
jgi:hypothetical protein